MGTAAVVGAQTGYRLCWMALLVAPLMGVVLAIAAQVGVVARSDLQSLARRRYGRRVAGALLISVVVVVNVVTIAADLQAGAAGIGLLAGVPVLGALVAASVIGGFGTPLGLGILVRLARDPQIMGSRPISGRLAAAGWAAAAAIGVVAVLLILRTAGGLA